MSETHYRLFGALGSPYTMKIRAVLRYRRIPHTWEHGAGVQMAALSQVKAPVIPVLQYPDGSHRNDSTPLVYDLEDRHRNGRGIVPEDAGDAFLAFLIEDFADEWLTKSMFHYRWFKERDQVQMSRWLSFDAMKGGSLANIVARAEEFRGRQVGRMPLVGGTPENAALIETATRRVLDALEAHVTGTHWLFGSRPSLAEFGIYGQLSQLGVDPTPSDMMRADYPYTYRWLWHVDDASGIEGEWRDPAAPLPAAVPALLAVAGEVYLPFLKANAAALAAGASEVRLSAYGLPYAQAPFKYQAKCLAELRRAFAALPEAARARIRPLLADTGCLTHLEGE